MNKKNIKEILRYDFNKCKVLIYPLFWIMEKAYWRIGAIKHLNFLSTIFRLPWPGTFYLCKISIKSRYLKKNNKLAEEIFKNFLENTEIIERYKKFVDYPEKMLNGVITVISPYSETQKGILVIKYSYYFLLFLKNYNAQKIFKHYYVVLEPSWNGLCEISVVTYSYFNFPIFVQAYEDRDYEFLSSLNSNIIPIRLSSNWWVDPNSYKTVRPLQERDIDIIMIAAWGEYKRHDFFFEALSKLKSLGKLYNVTLVGYPADLTINDIKKMAANAGIENQITFYEWISSEKVAELVGRAKVNVLWSRFEGLNRAIIEGMFGDTPCILRKGFNYGMQYPYINNQTGLYSSERNLASNLIYVIENYEKFNPRDYVLKNHNCFAAIKVLAKAIKALDCNFDVSKIVPKKNELHGMKYLNEIDEKIFGNDYCFLKSCINKVKNSQT